MKDAEVRIGGGREAGLPIELGTYMSMCHCDRVADYQRGKDNTDNLIGIPLMLGASAALIYGGLAALASPPGQPSFRIDQPSGAALAIGGAAALLSAVWVFHWGPAHQARNIKDFNECLRTRFGLPKEP